MLDWSRYSFTQEQFMDAAENSFSKREMLLRLGLQGSGGNYDTIAYILTSLGMSPPWKQGSFRSKSPVRVKALSVEEITVKNGPKINTRMKSVLINAGVLNNVCYECGTAPTWCGKDLTLHIDHIDGSNRNNVPSNLRMLCPNCHSQTPTFSGRNAKLAPRKKHTVGRKPKVRQTCHTCGTLRGRNGMCKICTPKVHQFKIDWPSAQWLTERLEHTSMLALSRELGVSDNAIRKHLRNHA